MSSSPPSEHLAAPPAVSRLVSTTNIHQVTRIELTRRVHSDFVTHAFVFKTADGNVVEVHAFASAADALDIRDMDLPAEVAA